MAANPENEEGAIALLSFFGSPEAGTIINTENPGADRRQLRAPTRACSAT